MRILKGHRSGKPILDLAFSPDGKKLASTARDYTVRLWDLEASTSTLAPVEDLELTPPGCWIAFAPDGKKLAWHLSRVRLWDLASGVAQSLPKQPSAVSPGPMAYSPDGRLLAVVRRRVSLWDVRDCAWRPMPSGQEESWSESVAFAPDGKTLAAGQTIPGYPQSEHFVHLWDTTTWQVRCPLRGHGLEATTMAFSPNSRFLAATCRPALLVWDVVTGATLVHHKIDKQHCKDVAFTPDGRFLLLARNDKTVRVWNTQTWSEQAAFDWEIGAIVSVAVAPDGMRAAAGGDKGKIVVWDLDL